MRGVTLEISGLVEGNQERRLRTEVGDVGADGEEGVVEAEEGAAVGSGEGHKQVLSLEETAGVAAEDDEETAGVLARAPEEAAGG